MKIEVAQLEEAPKIVEESLEASSWDLDSFDIKFLGEINLHCEFQKLGEEIVVKTKVFAHQEVRCSRCLDVFSRDIKKEFLLSYSKKTLGKFLVVDGDIREEVLLSWPMKPLCKEDCKGLCPGCGRNLNYENCICSK
ncbi:MAG TPA: DUF177 domain-containing protein [Candidatus Omnitrophica bacterium]|nr:MAG: hypothetical protein DRP61_01305 [Candidatus Omnitrophota bacterium]RKY34821.1 MAG: hypothetical protein DRP69_03555 [Candidatus Omnitrophota bacterium]RKY43853.1 MAG: hypothetical protein DRP80_04115 [Candidatus Omnitrophota bacterium]HEC70078.1 DUF177 domain-containing protein [Candidatus Omnitrophota bacterium]